MTARARRRDVGEAAAAADERVRAEPLLEDGDEAREAPMRTRGRHIFDRR